MTDSPFLGRTVATINDLTIDERKHLYKKARDLKEHRVDMDCFRINNLDYGIYEVFLEDSTRTKESFRNAINFHRIKGQELDVTHSSFNKSESYVDSINTLIGYNNSTFVIRSKLEGVCRYLEENCSIYAKRNNLNIPSFINAGDGKHEHPTQEILDGFTFLEYNGYDYSTLHIALVGDLHHGRTVHSKVDGLKIFDNVKVDLIAPEEIKLQDHYVEKMRNNGFDVKIYESIDEYLSQESISNIWYFTRPQLERMGEDVLKKQDELRSKITVKREHLDLIKPQTKFYHPLPRHKKHPTIPTFLDNESLNGWEVQSQNGFFTRAVLLGAVAGVSYICDDFDGETLERKVYEDNFIESLSINSLGPKQYKQGVQPIENGIVIDHILRGSNEKEIWQNIGQIQEILGLYNEGSASVAKSEKEEIYKGLLFLPNYEKLKEKAMKRLSAISPGCRVNLIENNKVKEKLLLHMPDQIYNFKEISCKNEACISHPINGEPMSAHFYKRDGGFDCKYCDTPHDFKEIWK